MGVDLEADIAIDTVITIVVIIVLIIVLMVAILVVELALATFQDQDLESQSEMVDMVVVMAMDFLEKNKHILAEGIRR